MANGQSLTVIGTTMLNCNIGNKSLHLNFHITASSLRHTLLGRIGLSMIWPDWRYIFDLKNGNEIQTINNSQEITEYQNDLNNIRTFLRAV